MFERKREAQETTPTEGLSAPPVTLLTVVGDTAKIEGKLQIADSLQIECEVGGELQVGGKLIIGEKGVVNATVETVDAVIRGHYDGNMTATGNVEIAATGRVRGNIKTDSLVISKGGRFRGNVVKINEEPVATLRPLYLIEDKFATQIGPRQQPGDVNSGDAAVGTLTRTGSPCADTAGTKVADRAGPSKAGVELSPRGIAAAHAELATSSDTD